MNVIARPLDAWDGPATILVRFQVEGFHHWPAARGRRAYLAERHRHMFHVEVRTDVRHDDREVEFHDLMDFARAAFGSGDFEDASCEMLARWLGRSLVARFGRAFTVSVLEDGEAGASVTSLSAA